MRASVFLFNGYPCISGMSREGHVGDESGGDVLCGRRDSDDGDGRCEVLVAIHHFQPCRLLLE